MLGLKYLRIGTEVMNCYTNHLTKEKMSVYETISCITSAYFKGLSKSTSHFHELNDTEITIW